MTERFLRPRTVGLLVAAALGVAAVDRLNESGDDPVRPDCNVPAEQAHKLERADTKLFDSEEANEVAGDLLISRSSYWQTETTTMSAIMERSDWDKEDCLLPIYPPAVMDYESDMKKVAGELDVPINVIGIIASIESAGKTDADSNVANGLFQVVPHYHREKIDRVAQAQGLPKPVSDAERIKVLQNPYIGCRVGMEILLEYRDVAIAQNRGLEH
jgi:hypothetical protein